ncbi:MAG: PepSY domain-containing protein [Desmonostoc vinosum HA7617-LM4]|jgi:uncharacterized iron-regulated membrane protein|nr:PepSY domain-containing protein [Desmonostoc vinosum HA7617-LM4]
MKIRTLALTLHRYIGIFAGVLLVIISVTGSLLVFDDEIDHLLNPHLLEVVPQAELISPQAAALTVAKAFPDLKLHSIAIPQARDGVYKLIAINSKDKPIEYYINPYNGDILGSRPWAQTVTGLIGELHVHLFAGELGGTIVGMCGILLFVVGITGVLLWNGWRRLAWGLQIRWRSPGKIINYDLHKVGGILSVVVLCVLALTGTAIVFWSQLEGPVYWLTGSRPKPAEVVSQVVAGVPTMGINAIVQKAEAALPGAKTFMIYLPKQPQEVFYMWMRFPQANAFQRDAYMQLDRYTGKILWLDNPQTAPLAASIENTQYVLHFGQYGGLLTRILYFVIGFIPVILFVTGIIIWQQRQWALARRTEAIRIRQLGMTRQIEDATKQ